MYKFHIIGIPRGATTDGDFVGQTVLLSSPMRAHFYVVIEQLLVDFCFPQLSFGCVEINGSWNSTDAKLESCNAAFGLAYGARFPLYLRPTYIAPPPPPDQV